MKFFSFLFFSFLACAVYLLLGLYTLSSSLETIKGMTGLIWTQMRAGFEKLDALESQLIGAYKDRKDVIAAITSARMEYAQAATSHDINKTISALESAAKASSALKLIVENYPSTDLSPMQVSMIDETAGIFNRIAYARHQLIQTQVAYNQNRILFFPFMRWFARQEVAGEEENPLMQGPRSKFA